MSSVEEPHIEVDVNTLHSTKTRQTILFKNTRWFLNWMITRHWDWPQYIASLALESLSGDWMFILICWIDSTHSPESDEGRITGADYIRWLGRGGRLEDTARAGRTGLWRLPNISLFTWLDSDSPQLFRKEEIRPIVDVVKGDRWSEQYFQCRNRTSEIRGG